MGLFRRKAAEESAALPTSIEAALASVSVALRGLDGDGRERVMVMFAGTPATCWHHSREETRRRLSEAWPDLSEAQLDRACQAVAGKIREARAADPAPARRSGWAGWKPARNLSELP